MVEHTDDQITHTTEVKDGTRIHRYFMNGELVRMVTYGERGAALRVEWPQDKMSTTAKVVKRGGPFVSDIPLRKIDPWGEDHAVITEDQP